MSYVWYTSEGTTLLKSKTVTAFRNSSNILTSSDCHAIDTFLSGSLREPTGMVEPLPLSNTYLPNYRTTYHLPGRWTETLELQTGQLLYAAMGSCTTAEATVNTHSIGKRTSQLPKNFCRHWTRSHATTAEREYIDLLGMVNNSYHVECSEVVQKAVQTADWTVAETKSTGTTAITHTTFTDDPYMWADLSVSTFTYNSETIQADIVGWAFDVMNTVRVTGLDSNNLYSKARYIPLQFISTTLQFIPYGKNAFELIRTLFESYATDLDLVVKLSRNATSDYIEFTHDKLYATPFDIVADKTGQFYESYFLRMWQHKAGSCTIEVKDGYNDDYYENP